MGICASPEDRHLVKQAGASYIELAVAGLAAYTPTQKKELSAELSAIGLPCEAMNVFFPGREIPITGPDADAKKIRAYVRETFDWIQLFNPAVVVIGSGAARRKPNDFSDERAMAQIIEAGQILADAAAPYGITLAIEPLNRGECNMINTVATGLYDAKKVGHKNFTVLADLYHMMLEDEPASALLETAGWLTHTHVASPDGRVFPTEADHGRIAPYITALKQIKYTGRMSIEASGLTVEAATRALSLVGEWWEER
jgi:sugar phosphate isomerase/epimerase